MKVQAFADDEDPVSSVLPAKRWIVFETTLANDAGRYCLHDGQWYELDRQLNERLAVKTQAIFDRQSPVPDLPRWQGGTEANYNQLVTEKLGGVNLDAKGIICDSNDDGFEACDILTPDQVFVHVKRVDKSSPLSHLLAQAAVSTPNASSGRLGKEGAEGPSSRSWWRRILGPRPSPQSGYRDVPRPTDHGRQPLCFQPHATSKSCR